MKSTQYIDIHTHLPLRGSLSITTAGVHPWHATGDKLTPTEDELANAMAIGEIGLDGVKDENFEWQLASFRAQLTIAERLALPVVIHSVRTFEQVMQELAKVKLRAVIFHGFVGSPEQAAKALDRGYFLSFGIRSLRSSKSCRAIVATPLNRLFCESDDAPTPIEEVYKQVARLKEVSINELQQQIIDNYKEIFE